MKKLVWSIIAAVLLAASTITTAWSQDWNHPQLTDTYSSFESALTNRDQDLALMLDPATTSPTNLPTNSIRWNSSNAAWEKYNGTSWSNLLTGGIVIPNGQGIKSAAGATVATGSGGNGFIAMPAGDSYAAFAAYGHSSSQSGDLLDLYNYSGGVNKFYVSASGNATVTGTLSAGASTLSSLTVSGSASLSTAAYSGAVTSTESCATGYTRITPNYCARSVIYGHYATFTNGACTTVAAPAADATAVVVAVTASVRAGSLRIGKRLL